MPNRFDRRQFVQSTAVAVGTAAWGLSASPTARGAESAWGDLIGRLVYDGPAPERKKLVVDKDVECCGKYDIRDESLMVGPDGGLANVYLYLRTRNVPVCPQWEHSAPKRVTLDNRDCIFKPHCLAIWYPKQEFYIVNSDPIAQNVAFSPLGDMPANIILSAVPGPNVDATWTFRRAQTVPVPIACNYHPWESAYILPRDNPYVAISAADGTFRIACLPAGRLEFQVWHERVGYLDTPQWPKGRFELAIRPGVNNLGTIKLATVHFRK